MGPELGAVIATDGAVSLITKRLADVELPAESVAVIVIVLLPTCSGTLFADQEVVPVQVPLPPLLLDHVTGVKPILSDAVPDNVIAPALVIYVEPLEGAVIATTGGVGS